jgi:uncharacterized iron-regulated membrane protein
MTSTTAKPRKRRPLGFLLHSLTGLYLCVIIGFVSLTGTIATVSHELEWVFMPDVRGSATQSDDWGAMWDAARRSEPAGYPTRIASFDGTTTSYFAREVDMRLPDGRSIQLYVNPADARVQGRMEMVAFHDTIRALHYYLFLPGDVPFYAITALGFVLMLSLVTGLVTYKKFWRGFWKMPRWSRGTRTWAGDLHRLAGLWSIWFVALMSLTSIWYLIEKASPPEESLRPEAKSYAIAAPADGDAINRYVALARAEMPGMAITAVELPAYAGDPLVVEGQWQAWLVRSRTNAVYIDPVRDEVLGRRVAHQLGAVERWVHTADALHFGNFGGLASKLIWVVFGLILTGMAVTGATVFAKRTRVAVAAVEGSD